MAYRVIQWATGAMGKSCLRTVIDHPSTDLVGLYVYGEAKAGRDAGDIARRGATGVLATRDIDEILALDADVVIHAARLAPPYDVISPDERDALARLDPHNCVRLILPEVPPEAKGDSDARYPAAARDLPGDGRELLLAIEMEPEGGDLTHEIMVGIPLNVGEFEA